MTKDTTDDNKILDRILNIYILVNIKYLTLIFDYNEFLIFL